MGSLYHLASCVKGTFDSETKSLFWSRLGVSQDYYSNGGGIPILKAMFRGQRTVTMFNVVHVLGFYMRLCGIGSVALGCRSCRSRQGGGGAGVGGKEPPMLREEKVGISHLATDMTLRRLEVGDKVAKRAGRRRIYLSLSAA